VPARGHVMSHERTGAPACPLYITWAEFEFRGRQSRVTQKKKPRQAHAGRKAVSRKRYSISFLLFGDFYSCFPTSSSAAFTYTTQDSKTRRPFLI
jgi:hypothetical protein